MSLDVKVAEIEVESGQYERAAANSLHHLIVEVRHLGGILSDLNRFPVDIDGTIFPSGLSNAGLVTSLALDDTAWVPLPATALTDRNSLAIQNQSDNGNIIIVNYDPLAPLNIGWRIYDGGYKEIPVKDNIVIYAKMLSGLGTALIDEVS